MRNKFFIFLVVLLLSATAVAGYTVDRDVDPTVYSIEESELPVNLTNSFSFDNFSGEVEVRYEGYKDKVEYFSAVDNFSYTSDVYLTSDYDGFQNITFSVNGSAFFEYNSTIKVESVLEESSRVELSSNSVYYQVYRSDLPWTVEEVLEISGEGGVEISCDGDYISCDDNDLVLEEGTPEELEFTISVPSNVSVDSYTQTVTVVGKNSTSVAYYTVEVKETSVDVKGYDFPSLSDCRNISGLKKISRWWNDHLVRRIRELEEANKTRLVNNTVVEEKPVPVSLDDDFNKALYDLEDSLGLVNEKLGVIKRLKGEKRNLSAEFERYRTSHPHSVDAVEDLRSVSWNSGWWVGLKWGLVFACAVSAFFLLGFWYRRKRSHLF